MSRLRAFNAVVAREIRTVVRTRVYALLSLGLAVVFVQLLRGSDATAGGYVPTAVDLLLPLEVLVPLVAVALGYRAFSGENDDVTVLLTYPLSRLSLVFGVFIGRLAGLAGVVTAPLAVVAVMVSRSAGPETAVFATHRGADSPVLFVRFVALTLAFGAVVLALTMAASVFVRTGRAALALALAVLVAVVGGGDILAFAGLASGTVGDSALPTVLAASPNSAYRGLVLEFVVGVATGRSGAIEVSAALTSLCGWLVAGLAVTTVGIGRRPTTRIESAIRGLFE